MSAATSDPAERLARVALGVIAEPADPRITALVVEHGAQEVLAMLRAQSGTDLSERIMSVDPDEVLGRGITSGMRYLIPGDAEWPVRLHDLNRAGILREFAGPPLGLWVRGPLRLDELEDSVAVVGSRSGTTYGEQQAVSISADLATAGETVVSGAAFGIDACAHRGAIAAGKLTVAVLACGLDRVYPVANEGLIRHIAATGALVSEYPPGSEPQRQRFLARNRLIAGLTRGTLVVEAAMQSGALNTAGWANRLQRVLMGVPGPVTSAPSAGVHDRIRDGEMSLVTDARDVLRLLYPFEPDRASTVECGIGVR